MSRCSDPRLRQDLDIADDRRSRRHHLRYHRVRRDVNELTPEQRNVAMAFETYALYPNFTVAENLAFPLEVRGLGKAERDREVARIAKLLRIDRRSRRSSPAASSAGLARAGADPRSAAFILDEVMSHLDAHLKFKMLFELKRIHRSLGKTTIYVTHDQVEALALADRIAVMSNAVLQQYGTRDDLYHRPVNRFVADFIGEPPTNFFAGEIAEDQEAWHCGWMAQASPSGRMHHEPLPCSNGRRGRSPSASDRRTSRRSPRRACRQCRRAWSSTNISASNRSSRWKPAARPFGLLLRRISSFRTARRYPCTIAAAMSWFSIRSPRRSSAERQASRTITGPADRLQR